MTESMEKVIIEKMSSKKDKLHPKPELDEAELPPSKKMKTSKVRISEKTHEVTIPENSVEVIETEINDTNANDTPSKRSFKPVSDYVKTPFSKIKEGDEDAGTPIKGSLSHEKQRIEQPNFTDETSPDAETEVVLNSSKEESEPTDTSEAKIEEKACDDCGKGSSESPDLNMNVTAISQEIIDNI
jgi:hypothetical protein